MPRNVFSKSLGVTLNNVPDEIDPKDPALRPLFEKLSAAGLDSGEYSELVAAPQMGVAETAVRELPQNLGVAARGAVGGLAGPVTMLADPLVKLLNYALPAEMQQLPPGEGLQVLLTRLGVPEPQTKAQEILQAATAGMADAGATTLAGRALAAAPGVVGGVGKALASGPAQNLAGGAASGAAAEAARQAGAGPAVQFGAGLAGGLVGGALGGKTLDAPPTGPVKEAEAAGVRLLTSDVAPPQTFASKWLRSVGEKIPVAGTGPVRQAQQAERVAAVRDIVRQYGADDLAAASDDVMRDLIAKRAEDLGTWTKMKGEVIEKLSEGSYKATPIDPYNLTYRESMQNRIEEVESLFPDNDFFPIVTIKDGKKIEVLDGHNRATIAKNKGIEIPHVSVTKKEYEVLQKQGFDDMEIANAALKRSGEFDAANAIDYQFSGAGVHKRGDKALEFLDTVSEPASATVPMPATVAKIDEQIAALQSIKTAQVNPVIDILTDWKQAIDGQDLENIELLRKQIGEAFKAPELASVRSTGEKALSSIYGAVRDDMTAYIEANGGQADLNKWQVANKKLAAMADELDRSAMKTVLEKGDTTPEAIRSMLFSRNRSDVEALYRNLSDKGKASARAAVLAKAVEGSGDPVSPDRFAAQVKKLGNQVGVFFTGDDLKQVQGLVRVLDYTKRAADAAVMPPTGVQLVIPGVYTALGQVFGNGIEGLAGSAAAMAATGGAARLYESKAVRNLLMQLPTLKPGSVEEAALLKRLLSAAYAVTSPAAGGAH